MSEKIVSKNAKRDLIAYIKAHPGERLWQCIRNWSKSNFILKSYYATDDPLFNSGGSIKDTFYENE